VVTTALAGGEAVLDRAAGEAAGSSLPAIRIAVPASAATTTAATKIRNGTRRLGLRSA
jgi:hypothetical protein